jgi:hypothetical protein
MKKIFAIFLILILACPIWSHGQGDTTYTIEKIYKAKQITIGGKVKREGDTFSNKAKITFSPKGVGIRVSKKGSGATRLFTEDVFKKKKANSIFEFFTKRVPGAARGNGYVPDLETGVRNRMLFPERRLALVIGNSNYSHPNWNNLANAISDARDVAEKLKSLGFDVMMLADGDLDEMSASIEDFFEKAKGYNVALFYFSGHGKREGDDDYILSTQCGSNEYTMSKLINESDAWIKHGQNNRKMIYVIDACRKPVGVTGEKTAIPKKETILFYSTSRDEPAWDQVDDSGNGPFAKEFVQVIGSTGKKVDDEFKIIRDSVESYTKRKNWQKKQTPEVFKDIDFVFRKAEPAPQQVGMSPKEAFTLAKANRGTSEADVSRRIELYKVASQRIPAAKDSLGTEYLNKGKIDSAFYWFDQSKSDLAIYKRALVMLDPSNSLFFGKQRAEALGLLESIASKYSPAAYYLGMIYVNDNFYRNGSKQVELYNKGLSLLRLAAQKGHREASEMLKELSE